MRCAKIRESLQIQVLKTLTIEVMHITVLNKNTLISLCKFSNFHGLDLLTFSDSEINLKQ
jgi:hypothetical protein